MSSLARAALADDARQAFPQSWYPMALAHEVTSTKLLGVDFLGTRVIVYRDADGRPVVQGAYCPHLGADLSIGEIVDGKVRCAFHHWSFGADGRCVHIPTGDKIPPGARLAAYPTAEAWGLVWAFNGETPLFPPPRIPDADETSLAFESHCFGPRPIDPWLGVSNGLDFQHLRAVHNLHTIAPETIDVRPYEIEYQVQTNAYVQHGLVTGANSFAQRLRRGGTDAWMLFTGRSVARGQSMSYYVVGVAPGPGAEQRLAGAKAMVVKLIDEDAPVLNALRFRKGTLVASDRFLARYFKYIAEFPMAAAFDG
jgi:phenylpropionate dioxygenase-like ring-hydroxylating dioxygenase large terminal subunit